MDWLKKHSDACVVIATIVGAALWSNNKFKDLEKDIAVIKAVLIMEGRYPKELATNKEK